jgi:hypothetical protein
MSNDPVSPQHQVTRELRGPTAHRICRGVRTASSTLTLGMIASRELRLLASVLGRIHCAPGPPGGKRAGPEDVTRLIDSQ